MFASHEVNVSTLVRERNELLIVCRSLEAAMRQQRRRQPFARWRTRVVAEQQLRWFRTTLLGRAPGFAPSRNRSGHGVPSLYCAAVKLLSKIGRARRTWTNQPA